MKQGIDEWQATGADVAMSYFLCRLASAYRISGLIDQGMIAIEHAYSFMEKMNERYFEPDIHLEKGEILLVTLQDKEEEAVLYISIENSVVLQKNHYKQEG